MGVLRRLLPSILLISAAGGLGFVGWRTVQAEAAVAERTALRELEAHARVAASRLEAAAQSARAMALDPDRASRLDQDGTFLRPEQPTAIPPLAIDRLEDPEGMFYLDGAERAERTGTKEEVRQLYLAAAAEGRGRRVRALALFRLAALIAGDEESGPEELGAQMAFIDQGLALLEPDERLTAEALVARSIRGSGKDADLLRDLVRAVGGPDDAIARGLLNDQLERHGPSDSLPMNRDRELDHMRWVSGLLPRTALSDSGVLRDGDRLLAWRRDADGRLAVGAAGVPALGPDITIDPVVDEELLVADVPVSALPAMRVAATMPRSEVEADARGRALLLGAALVLLVAGGITALAMTLRAARRHAAAARDQAAFLAQVGHDLRTPVANIRLYAETLASGRVGDPDEAQEFAGVAAREAARVSSMVEKVLELSRLDEGTSVGKREVVDVTRLIGEVIAAHRPLLEDAGMTVDVRGDRDPGPCVLGQPDALKGALGNLIENALAHAHDSKTIEITAEQDEHRVTVRVADRGPGLPTELGARCFERFVRGPKVTSRGCGLGLALVREVARAHGGDADARNRDGGGAEFTMTLPEAAR